MRNLNQIRSADITPNACQKYFYVTSCLKEAIFGLCKISLRTELYHQDGLKENDCALLDFMGNGNCQLLLVLMNSVLS